MRALALLVSLAAMGIGRADIFLDVSEREEPLPRMRHFNPSYQIPVDQRVVGKLDAVHLITEAIDPVQGYGLGAWYVFALHEIDRAFFDGSIHQRALKVRANPRRHIYQEYPLILEIPIGSETHRTMVQFVPNAELSRDQMATLHRHRQVILPQEPKKKPAVLVPIF